MTLSSNKDRAIQKALENKARKKKMDTTPPDNYGDQYVDPIKDMRVQGKGDRYRDIPGWYSEEVTQRLRRIYGKDKSK